MRQKLSAPWVTPAGIPAMAGIMACLFVISMKQKWDDKSLFIFAPNHVCMQKPGHQNSTYHCIFAILELSRMSLKNWHMNASGICILTHSSQYSYHIETSPLMCKANQWTGF